MRAYLRGARRVGRLLRRRRGRGRRRGRRHPRAHRRSSAASTAEAMFDHVYSRAAPARSTSSARGSPTTRHRSRRAHRDRPRRLRDRAGRHGGIVTTMPFSRALNAGLRAALAGERPRAAHGRGHRPARRRLPRDRGPAGRVRRPPRARHAARRVRHRRHGDRPRDGGFRPVCEIQFDGFVFPAFDQITTQLAKITNRHEGALSACRSSSASRTAGTSAPSSTTRRARRRTSRTPRACAS